VAECAACVTLPFEARRSQEIALEPANARLAGRSAEACIEWALAHLPGRHVLSSSFGAQGAVSLHLLTRIAPDIPVILIDTGYLFPETYRFVDELTDRLHLNLKIYRSDLSPAWQEARYGKLWEQGREGLEQYNRRAKVQPMERALTELGVGTWFAGLRRLQTEAARSFRSSRDHQNATRCIHRRLERPRCAVPAAPQSPYHPLWHDGYVPSATCNTRAGWLTYRARSCVSSPAARVRSARDRSARTLTDFVAGGITDRQCVEAISFLFDDGTCQCQATARGI
jgi:phosphoadenosine phosphosulfate reductase